MDYIDWCGHILNRVIELTQATANNRLMGVSEHSLLPLVFGEEQTKQPTFREGTQRSALLQALKSLDSIELIQDRGHQFYSPTKSGKEAARDMKPLWQEICSTQLDPEHEQLLRTVNRFSPQSVEDHAWLEDVKNDILLPELNWQDGNNLLWAVSQELEQTGLLRRDARMGGTIFLRSTYAGLVWEFKRGMFNRCDVFISHITEEKDIAHKLKDFLVDAFGDELKIFVSSDYRSIGGGKVWYSEIIENLIAAPVVLVLLSEKSVDRRWVNFEAGVGIGSGSLVIPLVTQGFAKSKVGLPLSQLQVRALFDAGDVEGMLSDVSEHIDKTALSVDIPSFITEASAVKGSRLEAFINHVPTKAYDGYEEHSFFVGLVNNSSKTLDDYRIDVEIPNDVVNLSTTYSTKIDRQSTTRYSFFRLEGKDTYLKSFRPGDREPSFWKIDLVIPPKLKESDASNQKIIVKAFAGDEMTDKLEVTISEVLAMQPSFG